MSLTKMAMVSSQLLNSGLFDEADYDDDEARKKYILESRFLTFPVYLGIFKEPIYNTKNIDHSIGANGDLENYSFNGNVSKPWTIMVHSLEKNHCTEKSTIALVHYWDGDAIVTS